MISTRTALILIAALAAAPNAQAQTAARDFCGRPAGEPAALQGEIAKAAGMKEIFRGPEYIAYQDDATQAVFTFTQEAQGLAHPAAVCRRPVKSGDSLTLQMEIVCKGAPDACQVLESDFKLLNAKMEAAIRNQAGEAGAKP